MKIKETAKTRLQGLFLIVLGCIVWKSAQGASVFLCFMGAMMLLHDVEKGIYKICLAFVRHYRRKNI
jgi:hypothetical protein